MDGKRVGDMPVATTFGVALYGNRFQPLNIKIEGSADPLPKVSDDAIKEACAALKPLMARFKDCKVSVYTIGGQLKMSATASGVEIYTPPNK